MRSAPAHLSVSDDRLHECDAGAMTIKSAAKFVGIGRTKVYELIADGTLHTTRVAGRRLVLKTSLIRLLDSGREQPDST